MPYSRPLLGTDLSDGARPAARLVPLFCAPDARGRAVLVMPYPDLPARVPREVREEITSALEDRRTDVEGVLREWLRAEKLDAFEPQVRYGSVGRGLAREAETADLVALGSTGASRIERVMLGSVARGVLRRVSCDTLIARPSDGIRRVLVATDFQPSSRAAAEEASAIATRTGAAVQILHVIDPGVGSGLLYPTPGSVGYDTSHVEKYVVDEIHRLNLERYEGKADERVVHGRAAPAIVSAAREWQADLVVVGSHGEGIASRILLGSVAESVVEHAPCSVLVVRPRRANGNGNGNGVHP